MTNKTKKILIAKIHIAKKDLALDDDTYRDVLKRVTGKDSCKKMSLKQLESVITEFKSKGWKTKVAKEHGKKPNVASQRKAILNKIEAILADMGLHWNYAKSMAKTMFDRDAIEWLTDEQLFKLMQALAVYQRRQTKKQTKEQKMKFKQGDKVRMVNCGEAKHYEGRVWTVDSDSFMSPSKEEVVFLVGFSGYFCCDCLELVNKKDSPSK